MLNPIFFLELEINAHFHEMRNENGKKGPEKKA